MVQTTDLRTIRLVGPRQPLKSSNESADFFWSAELALSYLGPSRKDLSIVNSTPGLRVLLQDPESDEVKRQIDIDIPKDEPHKLPAVNDKVSMRVPYLLAANVQARQDDDSGSHSKLWIADNNSPYTIFAAKPDPKPDVGDVTRGFSHLLVAPLDPWPTPQKSREIQMPRLALAANRIRVLVNAKGGTNDSPLGFLRLAKQSAGIVAAFVGSAGSGTPLSKLPKVELPAVSLSGPADGPFVALDLTPDGIEFRGTIVNPLRAFGDTTGPDRINVVLRLVCIVDPLRPSKTRWTLELVREEDDNTPSRIGGRIRSALKNVRSELRPGVGNPVFVDINTVADDLAVRWPLTLQNNALQLPGTSADAWTMWVDPAALRTSLAGTPVRGGELPTEVAIVANRLELNGSKDGVGIILDADRREAASQDGKPGDIEGPRVTLGARTTVGAKEEGGKTTVNWFVDQKLLARRLVERYGKAGVQPDAAKRTYAFLPLSDGWLQLPFDLPKPDSDDKALGFAGAASDSIGFAGTVDYVLDDGTFGEGPIGRRISIAAADYVHVEAKLKEGKLDTDSVKVELSGAAGTADGLLWLASGSPTAENILPGFGAGPAALESPALTFSRKTAATAELLALTSGVFTPGKALEFSVPKGAGLAPAYVWQGYSEMPFVTAIGITRTSESSGLPSSTRDLLCRELDRAQFDITLKYDGIRGIPALKLAKPVNELPLAGKDLLPNVPLVPVTLPGIEMQPAAGAYSDLPTRLRFDLPILDELFATTRLPEKPPVPSNDAPAPQPPPDMPTSLDFDGLLLAWQKAVDRLDLSRVQIASAFKFAGQSRAVDITTMIEGITWSTNFDLDPSSDIGGSKFAFGTYTLDGERFRGRTALEGLTETGFDKNKIHDVASGNGDPVKVIGFAAPLRNQEFGGLRLWRDTRAALMESLPTTDKFADEANGIVFREAGHFLRAGDSVQGTTSRYACTTIFEPVCIVTANDKRELGLWFRDLPLETTTGGKSLVDDPNGPELSIGPRQEAFDPEQLPRALYEWRVCNDAKEPPKQGLPRSAYDVDIGPLRLRPLRLLDLSISKQSGSWQIDTAKIVFTVSLSSSLTKTNDRGPFEPELAYATGNLVAILLRLATVSLIGKDRKVLKFSEWQDVQVATSEPAAGRAAVTAGGLASVSFRKADVQTKLGSAGKSVGTTTARLTLNIKQPAGEGGVPQFDGASLDTVLFGRSVVLTNGTVQPDGKPLTVEFKAPVDASPSNFSGVKLDIITLKIAEDSTWTMVLQGTLTISANGSQPKAAPTLAGKNVVAYTLGGPLRWLNQKIPEAAVTIDHQRGVMTCRIDAGPSKLQPIVGLIADQGSVRGILMVAVAPRVPTDGQFRFRSFSGFGELNLLSKDGPLQRFDHMIIGRERLSGQEPPWSSEITADLVLENRLSRIRWPIKSLPDNVKTLDNKTVKLENLGARLTGAALRGELKAFDDASALTHSFTTSVNGQAIETDALDANGASLVKPWSFHALTEHTIKDDAQRQLTWTSLDHVSAIDARALVSAAKAATKLPPASADRMFAFAPRYKVIDDTHENDAIAVKGGLVLRAFAQAGFPVEAMARAIADKFKSKDPGDAIVVSGAGPSIVRTSDEREGPFWPAASAYISSDPQGVVLALPWIGAVEDSYKLDGLIEKFCQAPSTGTATWDAADADWAAGSTTPLDRKSVPVQAIGSASDEIRALLARAMGNAAEDDANRALAAVEQLFLRLSSGGVTLGERPMWLRSLLALRTVWDKVPRDDQRPFAERVTMVLSSGKADGKAARVKLKRRDEAPDDKASPILARRGMLFAIDRNVTRFEDLPPGEGQSQGVKDAALGRARQVARADRLVSEAVAILVIAEKQRDSGADELWIEIDVPRDPDNSVLDMPIKIDPSDRLYASPALGWPTRDGTRAAASGALGMGGDWPFQDLGPKSVPVPPESGGSDVKSYGSGLSGRAASISLPARADRDGRLTDESVDVISPIFYALSRKMIFDRPKSAHLPLVSPPARYLTSSEARAVVPVALELKSALARVVTGKAAPMVPPHLERITFGLRPGAIQAEFDTLLFTDGIVTPPPHSGQEPQPLEDMSIGTPRYGRPGHGGPRLMRQLRPPRAPVLPRVPQEFVETHGRRTFVELDDLQSKMGFPVPFLLLEGVATVLRKDKKSYRIRVLNMPLVPEWNRPTFDDWKQGNVTLEITSPSFEAGGKELAKALAGLGLLRSKPGLYAALSINRSVVTFSKARWSEAGKAIRLTLHADEIAGAQAQLDAVDGDSDVVLLLQCGQDSESSDPPHQDEVFDLGPAGSNKPTDAEDLVPETRRRVSLRLPVRPTSRPSVKIDTSTLVFADPSYDRALCGPGASDAQRDNIGKPWKLGLDRFEYGSDTPLYLAFGRIDATRGTFADDTTGILEPFLLVQRQRQSGKEAAEKVVETLSIAGIKVGKVVKQPDGKEWPYYVVAARQAYAISFDQLRSNNRPVVFEDGDEIVISTSFGQTEPEPADPGKSKRVDRTLSARAKVVPRPVIAPPPAVYSLVVPQGQSVARVALHATAPLPQRIEFPALLDDLAIGFVRRRALFVWPMSDLPARSPDASTLLKVDRAGGGQLPEDLADIRSRLPLPGLDRIVCAGHVFGRTLQLVGADGKLEAARRLIAGIAYRRKGSGMPPPKIPSAADLADAQTKAIWERCLKAADDAAGDDVKDCLHVVIWYSDDGGKTPSKKPSRLPDDWPYEQAGKIDDQWGPFVSSAAPVGNNIFVMKYCGVT